jgi:hypothetical protein
VVLDEMKINFDPSATQYTLGVGRWTLRTTTLPLLVRMLSERTEPVPASQEYPDLEVSRERELSFREIATSN